MSLPASMKGGIALLLLSLTSVQARAPSCCLDLTRHSPCRYACEQLTVTGSSAGQLQQLVNAAEHCTQDSESFWGCVQKSVPVLADLKAWPGRLCCGLTVSTLCKSACKQATSLDQLDNKCRRSDELSFYRCAQRQKVGSHCCAHATMLSCKTACHNVYLNDRTSNQDQQQLVKDRCGNASPLVLKCLQNQTRSKPASNVAENFLPCCDRAESKRCRADCRRVLVTLTSEQEIVEELEKSCGVILPTRPLWQCFLSRSRAKEKNKEGGITSKTGTMVIDGAKLQCCSKATDAKCRELCMTTYMRAWNVNWTDFFHQCLAYSPTSLLKVCLDEVEEPCQFGCTGLEFCSNFNNRPSELFRSCTKQADKGARKYIEAWQNREIRLPQMKIPVKDIRDCEPEKWKAIACSLQVKPCRGKPGPIAFCWDDCMEILTKCIDPNKLPPRQNVETLCSVLAPRNLQSQCVPIKQYLRSNPIVEGKQQQVTNPCLPNPCPVGEMCLLNRRKCRHPDRCLPYICKPGCQMGEVSNFLVSQNSYVRIPIPQKGGLNCHKVYHCGHRRMLEFITDMPCDQVQDCAISNTKFVHNSHTTINCNDCICQGGEVFCAKRHCPSSQPMQDIYTGLPCNCDPAQYHPVCATNGRTYPSACSARCAGISDDLFHLGSCWSSDPCAVKPCSTAYRCLKRAQVCLSIRSGSCKQYICVLDSDDCNHHHHDEVCDTQGVEFTNICLLRSHGKTLAHWGHCLHNCATSGMVCGHNGETYSSECAAWSDWTTIDYHGACRTVGRLFVTAGNSVEVGCDRVECWPLRPTSCHGVIPPGGCCPVCAAELQLLFNPKMVDVISRTVVHPISVQNITSKLSEFIAIQECGVFGYLSIQGTVVILMAPLTKDPTLLQLEACNLEIRRMEQFLRMGSPNVMSHLSLTPLLSPINSMRTSNITVESSRLSGGGASLPPSLTISLLIGLLLIACHVILR